MKFTYDHDLHIHSQLSGCSSDPEQNNERILQYAKENGLHTICLTDHLWDENVEMERPPCYHTHSYENSIRALPLPQSPNVKFLFGCETELSKCLTLGLSPERQELFDFIIIPTTHLHFKGFTISEQDAESTDRKAKLWVERLEAVLNMHLPFYKTGIAHPTCILMAGRGASQDEHTETLKRLPYKDMERLFKKAAKLGVGIELNQDDIKYFTGEKDDPHLLPFQIAKECKCKFYLGSDAHHPVAFEKCPSRFEKAIELLELEETDKFLIKSK